MKPFLPRVGSKRRIINRILPLIPPHKTYVEPFFGGGAIFFAKPKSEVEVINDTEPELVHFYRTIKTLSPWEIPDGSITDKSALLKLLTSEPSSDLEKVLKYIVQVSNGFCSGRIEKTPGVYHTLCPLKRLRKFKPYKERLADTMIHNEDYADVIARYDAEDTFFFLDPPYESSSTTLYKGLTQDFDQSRLANMLYNVKGKFILTLNDSPTIRELYKDYFMLHIRDGRKNGIDVGTKIRKELIITNLLN
jgi:DNA adenine methylase